MAGGGIKINNIKVSGGADGATFTPSVDENGNLSWDNDRGYANPPTVNIKGADGKNGADGKTGAKILSQTFKGEDANGGYIYEQVFDDGTVLHFTAPRGEKGEKGEKGEDGETPEGYISLTEKGRPDGVATLNSNGEIPQEQLPALDYVEKTGDTMSGALTIKNDDLKEVSVSGDGISFNMDGTSGKQSGFNRESIYLYTSGVSSGTEVKSDGVTVDFILLAGKAAYYLVDGVRFTYNGAYNAYMKFPTSKEGDETFAMLSDVSAVEELVKSLETQVILQNQALLQSGIMYTADDIEVWNERVTAKGLNVLDGSKAVLKKVVGNTVRCEQLFDISKVVEISKLSKTDRDIIVTNNYATNAGEGFTIKDFFPDVKAGVTYTASCTIEMNAPVYASNGEVIVLGGPVIIPAARVGYVKKTVVFAEEDLSKPFYFYGLDDSVTGVANSTVIWKNFLLVEGDYTNAEMPLWQPYFTGLKSASFGGIESTNADETETSTLSFPKTETPLGTTIDFENKKITKEYAYLEQSTPFTEEQLANYTDYIISQDGKSIMYKLETSIVTEFTAQQSAIGNEYIAYKGGTETVLDNDGNEYGADNTITVNYMFITEDSE